MLNMKKFFAFFIPSKQFVPVVECFSAFLVMPGPVLVLVLLHQCSCKLHLEAFWQSTRLATVGQVLNETSVWWFNKTRHITGNSLVVAPDPNVTIARKCSVFPVEFVGMWSSTCDLQLAFIWSIMYRLKKGMQNFSREVNLETLQGFTIHVLLVIAAIREPRKWVLMSWSICWSIFF